MGEIVVVVGRGCGGEVTGGDVTCDVVPCGVVRGGMTTGGVVTCDAPVGRDEVELGRVFGVVFVVRVGFVVFVVDPVGFDGVAVEPRSGCVGTVNGVATFRE